LTRFRLERIVGRADLLWNSSHVIDAAILSLTARTIWASIVHGVCWTKFRRCAFQNDLEPDSPVVVVQGVKLNTNNSITDHRLATSRKRRLSALSRQSWVLQAGVAVVRSVIQDGESVVQATFINICFYDSYFDICSMKSTDIPATIKTSRVEGVGVVGRGYFNWVMGSLQLNVHRNRGAPATFIGES